jgi:hypothetical protein
MADCGGALSVERNCGIASVPAVVRAAFEKHKLHEPHTLGPARTSEVRKGTTKSRHCVKSNNVEQAWEWFAVTSRSCSGCGAEVETVGKLIFRGLASERARSQTLISRGVLDAGVTTYKHRKEKRTKKDGSTKAKFIYYPGGYSQYLKVFDCYARAFDHANKDLVDGATGRSADADEESEDEDEDGIMYYDDSDDY